MMDLPDQTAQGPTLRTWIVTGGVACGKSAVTTLIGEMLGGDRARQFSCDEEVKKLYQSPEIVRQIRRRFGAGVMADMDGARVDRERLRQLVFGDDKRRRELERILHPPVLASLESARAAAAEPPRANLFVAEVPLFYEIGGTVPADHVIVVASSPDQQVSRLMQHRGLDRTQAESIVGAQLPILDKVQKASKVIWNDGSMEALEDQIACLVSLLDTQ